MDPTDTRSPPTPTAAGVRRHAAAYVADLLATCQLRGAFTLEEADGLLGVVRGLETLAATEDKTDDNDTEAAHTDDAEGGYGDDHGQATDTPDPTLHSPLWSHAWDRLTLAQARGKLSLREAWSVYNAMQLCGGDDKAVSTADDAAAETTPPTDGAPAAGGCGAGGGGAGGGGSAWTA